MIAVALIGNAIPLTGSDFGRYSKCGGGGIRDMQPLRHPGYDAEPACEPARWGRWLVRYKFH